VQLIEERVNAFSHGKNEKASKMRNIFASGANKGLWGTFFATDANIDGRKKV
jgi:hypothetical protein